MVSVTLTIQGDEEALSDTKLGGGGREATRGRNGGRGGVKEGIGNGREGSEGTRLDTEVSKGLTRRGGVTTKVTCVFRVVHRAIHGVELGGVSLLGYGGDA